MDGFGLRGADLLLPGDNWQLAAVAIVGGNICLGAAGVFNDAILPLISEEHERDRVSSRGWAWATWAAASCSPSTWAVFTLHDSLGLTEEAAR